MGPSLLGNARSDEWSKNQTKPPREFNTGMDKRAKQNSKDKNQHILLFDTKRDKWDRELLWQGKKEGDKMVKK